MYIAMEIGASKELITGVKDEVIAAGFTPHENVGEERTVITCLGGVDAEKASLVQHFRALPGVKDAQLISPPYKLAARKPHQELFSLKLNGATVGGPQLVIMAGPCSVESREQILEVACFLKDLGVHVLRGGAFKPRTSPYGFQGLGEEGLQLLAEAREKTGLPVVTEAMDVSEVELVASRADVIQLGARSMQTFRLLKAVGKSGKPCLFKRGPAASIDEMLQAAEYILCEGNQNVMLCPRGIRGIDNKHTRNSADIDAIPVLKALSYLPVIFDPSHAAGKRQFVSAMALAAVAAGADGLIIEVHPDPTKAKTDADQQLNFAEFRLLMRQISRVAEAVGRTI